MIVYNRCHERHLLPCQHRAPHLLEQSQHPASEASIWFVAWRMDSSTTQEKVIEHRNRSMDLHNLDLNK